MPKARLRLKFPSGEALLASINLEPVARKDHLAESGVKVVKLNEEAVALGLKEKMVLHSVNNTYGLQSKSYTEVVGLLMSVASGMCNAVFGDGKEDSSLQRRIDQMAIRAFFVIGNHGTSGSIVTMPAFSADA